MVALLMLPILYPQVLPLLLLFTVLRQVDLVAMYVVQVQVVEHPQLLMAQPY